MKIEIPYQSYEQLKKLLEILEKAKLAHEVPEDCNTTNVLLDNDHLIEPWAPSEWEDSDGYQVEIYCPDLTVGVLRMASKLKKDLKL